MHNPSLLTFCMPMSLQGALRYSMSSRLSNKIETLLSFRIQVLWSNKDRILEKYQIRYIDIEMIVFDHIVRTQICVNSFSLSDITQRWSVPG